MVKINQMISFEGAIYACQIFELTDWVLRSRENNKTIDEFNAIGVRALLHIN